MSKMIDITGKRFGRLRVISRVDHGKPGEVWWACACDCGKSTITRSDTLRNGKSRSCGCLLKEVMSSVKKKHGFSNPQCQEYKLYAVWRDMVGRCRNPRNSAYNDYGGRGIDVCQEWKESPEKFIAWGRANGWAQGLQIDRIDNDRGYSPHNCRFTDHTTNIQNQRLIRTVNTTGFRGVYFHKKNNKYIAQAHFSGHRYYLGSYSAPVSAAIARDMFILSVSSGLPLNFEALRNA